MKKGNLIGTALCAGFVISLAGCGMEKGAEADEAVTGMSIEKLTSEDSAQQDSSQDSPYDAFLDSKISAKGSMDGNEFEIWYKDLPQDPDEWDSYSVSDEKVDLDNDGESELILNGPYGGMYLDARDGKVFVLAQGEGTAGELGYVEYEGKTYIYHCDVSHMGRQVYLFDCYDGSGNIVDSFDLSAEYYDSEFDYYNSDSDFTFRGQKITMEEFEKHAKEILDRPTKVEMAEKWALYEMGEFGNEADADKVVNDASDTFYDALDAFYGEYSYVKSTDGLDGTLYLIQEFDNSREYSIYESNTNGFRFIALGSNVEYIKGSKLYMKYPETVYEDDTAIFKYYIIVDHDYYMFLYETDENYKNPVYLYTAWKKY